MAGIRILVAGERDPKGGRVAKASGVKVKTSSLEPTRITLPDEKSELGGIEETTKAKPATSCSRSV